MKKDKTYGEFPLTVFSKFAYNNSNANKFFPKTKEEVKKMGYIWNDEQEKQAEATIKAENLPETIAEVDDSILNQVIACNACDRNYKISQLEFNLLRKMRIPLPIQCLKFKKNKQFIKIPKPRLYGRNCDKCDTTIQTSFPADDSRIVYCVPCYQQEFI